MTCFVFLPLQMCRVIVLLFLSLSAVRGQGIDPCSSYTLYAQAQRDVSYTQTSDLCDRLLPLGWYRFKDAELSFGKCVSQYHCGTHIPLWINGSYPSVVDGLVTRVACGDMVTNNSNCCDYHIEIAVKNCHTYFVYYLQPVKGCSMAYCTVKTPGCTGAEYSKTGFPPCTDAYPVMTQEPTLSFPELTATDYEFRCHINYPQNKQDAIFEVTWLIDGKTNIRKETLTAGQRDAFLPGEALEGHMNSDLSCSVVSSFLDHHTGGLKSPPLHSNNYWVGVKYSTNHVNLNQATPDYQVTLTSTVPVVCRHSSMNKCAITFQLTTDNENISPSTCHVSIKSTDWNPVTSTAQTIFIVGMKPSIPMTTSTHSTLHIDVTSRPGREWNNYQSQNILVDVMSSRPGAQCLSTGDPHYRTFDNKKQIFTNLHVGQYTMVRQKKGSFKVETRTWKHPGGKASFNCAVAAREGNDVIVVDMCYGRWGQTYPRLEIKNPSMFENKTEIVKDPSGNHFVMKFQSGAIVKVQKGRLEFLNVIVSVPGTFMYDTEGLCGSFDGNPGNDFQHSNGQIESFVKEPYPFIESWSIPAGTSLFEKAEPLPVTTKRQNYCACLSQSTNKQCNPVAQSVSVTDLCTGCMPVAIAPSVLPLPTSTAGVSTTLPPVFHKSYNFPPPTSPPQTIPFISRPEANRHCLDLLDKYPSAKSCIRKIYQLQFTEIVTMCVTDIELTGDVDMALSALVTLMEGCGFQSLVDQQNTVNGTFTLPPEAKVCPGACSGNGDCQNGLCTCVQGFEGPDCSIRVAQPPVLTEIAGGKTCDLRTQECYQPVMLGENMKENATTCNIRRVYYSDFGSSMVDLTATHVKAEFMSTHHVACPLPKDPDSGNGYALHGYMVSLTNNGGTTESKEYLYTIYNSECVMCDDQGSCTTKHDACNIENRCYSYGDKDVMDNQGWCIPSISNSHWTKQILPLSSATPTHIPTALPSSTPVSHGSSTNNYTAVGSGCGCYFEPSRSDCACCKNYGCPCDAANKHVCFDCINPAICDSTP